MKDSVNTRILQLLKEMGMSQKELADMLNTSEANVSRYLNGDRSISTEMIANMATILHTTTDYLLGVSEEKDKLEYKDIERVLARKAETMSKDQRKKLIDILFG